MKSAKILAVIPARGGSKRLPRKNIKKLGGKPLIHYTIQACIKSSLITDHVFSTEDQQIKEIAISLGANAPFTRPLELAEDPVRNSETLTHALHFMENMKKIKHDALMLLQPTKLFRNENILMKRLEFLQSGASSLASVRGPIRKEKLILKK